MASLKELHKTLSEQATPEQYAKHVAKTALLGPWYDLMYAPNGERRPPLLPMFQNNNV